jgi:hypothetical protein
MCPQYVRTALHASSYEGALLLDLTTATNTLHASSYGRAERALLLDFLEHYVDDYYYDYYYDDTKSIHSNRNPWQDFWRSHAPGALVFYLSKYGDQRHPVL